MQNTQALEYIADEMLKKGMTQEEVREKVHQAVLLSTLESTAKTLSQVVMPTPLYRIYYNDSTMEIEVTKWDGVDRLVPKKGAIDIDYGDLVQTSLACDKVNILTEGTTGVGKTYTLDMILKAVFDPQNRKLLRLGPNMSNVMQPYISGSIEGGLLKISINQDAVENMAALGIDEQGRGPTGQLISLLDHEIILATGERAVLGLRVPQMKVNGKKAEFYTDDDKIKPVAVYGAQNPAKAEYNEVIQSDAAVGNRQLTIQYPNGAVHFGGATATMRDSSNHHHEKFMQAFVPRLAGYLNVDEKKLSSTLLPQSVEAEKQMTEHCRANSEYVSLHAFGLDHSHTQNAVLKSAIEMADHIIFITGSRDLEQGFKSEALAGKSWTQNLSRYKVSFEYNGSIDPASQEMQGIKGVTSMFREEVEERDKAKASTLSDAFALIIKYKTAYLLAKENGTSPVEEFDALDSPLTIREMAAGYTIALDSKLRDGATCQKVVRQSVKDYIEVLTEFSKKYRAGYTGFNLSDPNQGIRFVAAYAAVDACNKTGLTGEQYAKTMIEQIEKVAADLRTMDHGSDTKKLLICRANSDLASLAGFIDENRGNIADAFNSLPNNSAPISRYLALKDIAQKSKEQVQTDYTHPAIDRVFGL